MNELREHLHHIRSVLGIVGDQETVNRAGELEELINQQAGRVDQLERRNKELEYASKHNAELNEFLQKRKLPPKTLGRHVVDVVMEHVEKLEEEKKRYKQALEAIEENTCDLEVYDPPLQYVNETANKALSGEPNET